MVASTTGHTGVVKLPTALTPEVLTAIYGEEDWQATIRKDGESGELSV